MVPSSHLEKVDLISAVAAGGCTLSVQVEPLVMVSVTGAVYAPEGHPAPDTPNVTDVFVSIRTSGDVTVKFAVTVLGASITRVNGLAVPEADPLQPVNRYPVAGVAVNCKLEPAA